jgi:hypothetical protein
MYQRIWWKALRGESISMKNIMIFLQISVPVDKFDRTDLVDKENCKKQGCKQKSGNGKCDPECNLVACNFDGKL